MALDYYIGTSAKQVVRDPPAGEIEEDVHRSLFKNTELIDLMCPGLLKIKGYYCDAHFAGEDLEALERGLIELISHFSYDAPISQSLERLRVACLEAGELGIDLFFFGD